MSEIIPPEQVLVDAQEAVEASRNGDMQAEKNTIMYDYDAGELFIDGVSQTTAEPGINQDAVAAVFKPADPFA